MLEGIFLTLQILKRKAHDMGVKHRGGSCFDRPVVALMLSDTAVRKWSSAVFCGLADARGVFCSVVSSGLQHEVGH